MRIVIHFPPTMATVAGTSTAISAQYRGRAERFHRFPLQFPALSSPGTIEQEAISSDSRSKRSEVSALETSGGMLRPLKVQRSKRKREVKGLAGHPARRRASMLSRD